MHRRLSTVFLVAIALLGCSGLPRKGQIAMRDVQFPLWKTRLPSGVQVVVERDTRVPLVGVVTVVGAGSTADPEGKEGLAHVVEHLTYRSSAGEPGQGSIWDAYERAGAGEMNAYTALDQTTYYAVGPKGALPELLRLEGQRLLNPIRDVPEEVFTRELEVVRNELRLRNELGYGSQAFTWLKEALFPDDHLYFRSVIGDHASLSALTLRDAEDFAAEHYRPDNVTLLIIGDVELESVEEILESSLPARLLRATRPPGATNRLSRAKEPPVRESTGLPRYEAPVTHPELWIGWTLPRGFDEDSFLHRFVALAAASELGGAFAEDADISNVQLWLARGAEASVLVARVTLNKGENPERSRDVVLDQMYRVWVPAAGGLAQRAHDVAIANQRIRALGSMIVAAEDLTRRGTGRAESFHFTGDPTLYSRSLAAVAGVTDSLVTDFAYKYLSRDRARAIFIDRLPEEAEPAALAVGEGVDLSPADERALPEGSVSEQIRALPVTPTLETLRTVTLENGLEVILGRMEGLPTVSVVAGVRGGLASQDMPGLATLASLIGSPQSSLRGSAQDVGGSVGSFLGRMAYFHSMGGAAGNTPNFLALMAERISSMGVDEGWKTWVDQHRLEYYEARLQAPELRAEVAFWAALYPDDAYGTARSLEGARELSHHDIRRWFQTTHTPANTVVAVVGEIDLDETEAQARRWFAGWSGPTERWHAPSSSPRTGATLEIVARPDATQTRLRFGCRLPSEDLAAELRNEVMASVLGDRLHHLLREQLGATYGVSLLGGTLPGGTGYLSGSTAVENPRLETTLKLLRTSLGELAVQGPSPAELEHARWAVARREAVAFDTTSAVAEAAVSTRLWDRPLEALEQERSTLADLDAQTITAGFAACRDNGLVTVLVGPEGVIDPALQNAGWRVPSASR